MNVYLLQVAPSQLINSLLILLATGFVLEVLVLQIMKWDTLVKSAIHSLLVNLAAVLLSALLFLIWQEVAKKNEIEVESWWYVLAPMFVIILLFEAQLLKFLKPGKKFSSLLLISLLMNLCTGLVFYLFVNNFKTLTQSL